MSEAKNQTKTIKVNYLARVEGEGGLFIKAQNGKVKDVQLRIFEPPRFFEGLLVDRAFTEAPDITARICGICPVAYQMSACQAMENACGITVDGPLRDLRRLLYCGEWIKSHVLHIYMLHAPDFLGYEGVVQMAKDFPQEVERGLRLKKVGNDLMSLVGGRDIHPINVCLGGFYKTPTFRELLEFADKLKQAHEDAIKTLEWLSTFRYPQLERGYLFVSLCHPHEYPIDRGKVISSAGLNIDVSQFENFFFEKHLPHSTALHATHIDADKKERDYLVGPMARFNLNFNCLTPTAKYYAEQLGLTPPCTNPFKSIAIRAIEVLYAIEEALRLIDSYHAPFSSKMPITPKANNGYGCTEAPRGILYHRYEIDEQGIIKVAKIVPPTSQNQKIIEEDLRHFVERYFSQGQAVLQHHCEQAIRNYDPCISCATHFLKLHIDEE
ncbi:MAG: Ni/Fe hydrogenase subunit alpha [Deltaproteobacteria bacterium]|nr:Ni/Fe hydrogenase subunit alpha [Deltaproteobacteria bacterium]